MNKLRKIDFLSRQCEEAMAVLQKDNEQLEEEKAAMKERIKQLTKDKLVGDLMQKKIGSNQRTSALSQFSSKNVFIRFEFNSNHFSSLFQVQRWTKQFRRNDKFLQLRFTNLLPDRLQLNKRFSFEISRALKNFIVFFIFR